MLVMAVPCQVPAVTTPEELIWKRSPFPTVRSAAGVVSPIPTLFAVLMKIALPVCLAVMRIAPPVVAWVEISKFPVLSVVISNPTPVENISETTPRAFGADTTLTARTSVIVSTLSFF